MVVIAIAQVAVLLVIDAMVADLERSLSDAWAEPF
jgi:hypothetical protein